MVLGLVLSLLLVLSLDIWDFEGASSSSLLVLKPKLFSLTMLLLGLTIGSTLVEESLNVVALLGLELSTILLSSNVSETGKLAVGADIAVVT